MCHWIVYMLSLSGAGPSDLHTTNRWNHLCNPCLLTVQVFMSTSTVRFICNVVANPPETAGLKLLVSTNPNHSTMLVIVGETLLSFGINLPGAAIAHCAMGTS
jgi:hypothetical protein